MENNINEKDPIEGPDIPTSEIVEKAVENGDSLTKKGKKITKEETNKFLEANKENIEKINWDEIIFDDPETKWIPTVTKDDIEVYSTITREFVGDMSIDAWLEMSKIEINEYLKIKDNPDEDPKYLESCKKTAEGAKELLALIQIQVKDLRKEFVDNQVAESAIKAAVLKTLHDFIIKRWPIVAKNDEEKRKIIAEFEKNEIVNMYVIPIFQGSVIRDHKRFVLDDIYRLSPENIDLDAYNFTNAVSTYVKFLNSDNIDVSSIITKDFEFMNFFVITVLYSVYKYGDKDFVTKNIKNITDETLKSLDETMNPNEEVADIYKNISEITFKLIEKWSKDINSLEKLSNDILKSLNKDKKFVFYYNKNDHDIEKVFSDIIANIPSIEGTKMGPWNTYYRVIRKLNLLLTFDQLNKLGKEKGIDSDDFKSAAFNVIIKLMKYMYESHFTRFISDFISYLNTNINSKESREIFFKTSMNMLNVIHSFGFKASYNSEEKENVAPKIYELAKVKMGEKIYKTTIIDDKTDILLRDVDLKEVKRNYASIVDTVLDDIYNYVDK